VKAILPGIMIIAKTAPDIQRIVVFAGQITFENVGFVAGFGFKEKTVGMEFRLSECRATNVP